MNTAREQQHAALLERVRAALGRGPEACPPPPDVDESLARLCDPGEDLPSRFAARAQVAGCTVHHATLGTVAARLTDLLRSLGCRSAAIGMADADAAKGCADAVRAAGASVTDWTTRPGLTALYDVDVGITDVRAAIAETGTLVMAASARHSRGGFVVPPIHVALVRARDIVPDLLDLWPTSRDAGEEMPACLVLVTGPSKTADIEGILITGVHGPREVHVVLVER